MKKTITLKTLLKKAKMDTYSKIDIVELYSMSSGKKTVGEATIQNLLNYSRALSKIETKVSKSIDLILLN